MRFGIWHCNATDLVRRPPAGRPRRQERRMQQLDNKEANGFTVSHDSEQKEHTPHRSARGQSVRHIYPRRLRALSGSPSRDRDPGTVTPRLAVARSAASAPVPGHAVRLVSGDGTRRRCPLGAAATPAVDRGTVDGGLARPVGVGGMRASRTSDVVRRQPQLLPAPDAATRVSPSRRTEPGRGCRGSCPVAVLGF